MNKQSKPFAKRSLGQNFLVDQNVVARIVGALELKGDETVLEIGPGRGALTGLLTDSCERLILVEKDDQFATVLGDRFSKNPKVKIFNHDFLEFDFDDLQVEKRLRVVGNLPYNVGTAILQRIAHRRELFEKCVFMLQKEVVERITASVSSPDRGYLSVVSQYSFDAKKLFDVSPDAFRPRPKVTSSVVRLNPIDRQIAPDIESLLMKLVSAGFLQRRKTIFNNLKNFQKKTSEEVSSRLETAGIEKDRRAESLSVDEWIALAVSFAD